MMEKRKIMQLGRSSLVISLPQEWINLTNAKKGDMVDIEIKRDRSLAILPNMDEEETPEKITLHIDPTEHKDSITRSIIACYLNGYTNIQLISKKIFTPSQQTAIRKWTKNLYMRVLEADLKSVEMEFLVDELRVSIEANVRRMFNICKSMITDIMDALKTQDAGLARSIFSLDDEVDHFSFFILRLLRRASLNPGLSNKLELDPIKILDYQVLAYRIEHVADQAASIASILMSLHTEKSKIPQNILDLIVKAGKDASQQLDAAFDAFFTKDITQCNSIIEKKGSIIDQYHDIASATFNMPEVDAKIVCSICNIRDSIVRISDWAATIAENAISRFYSYS
jgi:phosphate uptake regulator